MTNKVERQRSPAIAAQYRQRVFSEAMVIQRKEDVMTPKPIDAHCHLFSARYVVEEAAFKRFQKRVIALAAEGVVQVFRPLFGKRLHPPA
jgi:arginyl-tRNA--protein-N-Asp/Glu arginylyltransferase